MRETLERMLTLLKENDFNITSSDDRHILAQHKVLPINIEIRISDNKCEIYTKVSTDEARDALVEKAEDEGFESITDEIDELESVIDKLSIILKNSCREVRRNLEGLFDLRDIVNEIEEEFFE